MYKRKITSLFLTTTLLLSTVGCAIKDVTSDWFVSNTESIEIDENSTKTIKELKQFYGTLNDFEIKPFYNVNQDTCFNFHFNSPVEPCQAVTVHTDPKCELSSTVFQFNDGYKVENGVDVVVKPYKPVLKTEDRQDYEEGFHYWGYAPVYYLCIRYDMNSNELIKLENPIIIPFTIKNKISTPTLRSKITDKGDYELVWNEVPNAVKYNIYKDSHISISKGDLDGADELTRSECAYEGDFLTLLDTVNADTLVYSNLGYDGDVPYYYTGDNKEYISSQNVGGLDNYYITAVDKDGNESSFSMAATEWKYASQLPYSVDTDLYTLETFPETVRVQMADHDTYTNLPINFYQLSDNEYSYAVVGTKLSGHCYYEPENEENTELPTEVISTKQLNTGMYEVENDIDIIPNVTVDTVSNSDCILDLSKLAERDKNTLLPIRADLLYVRSDMENIRLLSNGIYKPDYTPDKLFMLSDKEAYANVSLSEGFDYETNADGYAIDEEYYSTYSKDILNPQVGKATINYEEKAQDTSSKDKPDKEITSDNYVETKIEETIEEVSAANEQTFGTTDYLLFADSAEEYYLAVSMINAETSIDLSAFPKLQNTEILFDTVVKVIKQNPYIISPERYTYDGKKTLEIIYSYDTDTIKQKQKECKETAESLIKELELEGKTDDEKLEIIWTYLEDNTKYDTDACNQGKSAGFLVENLREYADSFNLYGILVKRVGVCQSYAYTTKLLCSMVGLDVMTVTGYLEKTLPHAWNAIKLNNEWYLFDTTNNYRTSGIKFMLYKSSLSIAEQETYVLGDEFELDSNIDNLITQDNTKDWYYENNLYAEDIDALCDMIVQNYNMNEKLFSIKLGFNLNLDDKAATDKIYEALSKKYDKLTITTLRYDIVKGFFVLVNPKML